jgi:hypothetical protein
VRKIVREKNLVMREDDLRSAVITQQVRAVRNVPFLQGHRSFLQLLRPLLPGREAFFAQGLPSHHDDPLSGAGTTRVKHVRAEIYCIARMQKNPVSSEGSAKMEHRGGNGEDSSPGHAGFRFGTDEEVSMVLVSLPFLTWGVGFAPDFTGPELQNGMFRGGFRVGTVLWLQPLVHGDPFRQYR